MGTPPFCNQPPRLRLGLRCLIIELRETEINKLLMSFQDMRPGPEPSYLIDELMPSASISRPTLFDRSTASAFNTLTRRIFEGACRSRLMLRTFGLLQGGDYFSSPNRRKQCLRVAARGLSVLFVESVCWPQILMTNVAGHSGFGAAFRWSTGGDGIRCRIEITDDG
jgi:hypothetical protein